LQCRTNPFSHELGTRCGKKEKLSPIVKRNFRVKK